VHARRLSRDPRKSTTHRATTVITASLPRITRFPRVFTLADGLALPQDNFLLLRTLAAVAVIYGHGYAMVKPWGPSELFTWLRWGTYSGAMAVDVFFLVSGFLVTGSFLRRRNVLEFLWARALRVMPAYVACLLGCALVIGPLYTTLPLGQYLHHPQTRAYVLNNVTLVLTTVWQLPGVFVDNPRLAAVNGSIWTLPAEVRMYLWVALVGGLGILSRRAYCNVLLLGLFVLGLLAPDYLLLVSFHPFVRLAGFFALGVFCYLNRDRVPVNGWLLLSLAALSWLVRDTPMYPFAFGLSEAAFAFWFAYRIRWYGYNRFGDYSYGLYLWGFPAEQVFAHHFPTIAPLMVSALGLVLATTLAVASWHGVEKPAIALKSLPRRLWIRWRGSGRTDAIENPAPIAIAAKME
jgi:peptidoglycan/LPS O-acetylase OafA/YrhL